MKSEQEIPHIALVPIPEGFTGYGDLMRDYINYLALCVSPQFSESMKGVTLADYVAFKEVDEYLQTITHEA